MKRTLCIFFSLVFCFCLCLSVSATEVTTEDTGIIDSFLAKFTDSSFWIAIIGFLVSVVSVLSAVAVFFKKIKNVAELIKGRATKDEIINAVKEANTETQKEIEKKLNETKEALAKCTDREEELTTLIALLIDYSNINPTAKAEIMARVSGLKKLTGSVVDIVKEVEAQVEQAKNEEIKPETPALDKIAISLE